MSAAPHLALLFSAVAAFLAAAPSPADGADDADGADGADPAAKRFTVAFLDLSEKLDEPPAPLTPKRVEIAARELSAASADAVILSGLASEKDRDAMRKALGPAYVFAATAAGPAPNGLLALFAKTKPGKCEIVSGKKYNIKKNTPVPVGNDFILATFDIAGYKLEILAALLKDHSKHPVHSQTDMRRYEARELRKVVTAILRKNPEANILVVGNMNDTCGKSPLMALYSRRSKLKRRLFDLRPVDHLNVAWTAVDEKKDEYERYDYLLASSGLVPEIITSSLTIERDKEWRGASAHRPLRVAISCGDTPPWSDKRLEKEFPYSIRYADFPVGRKDASEE